MTRARSPHKLTRNEDALIGILRDALTDEQMMDLVRGPPISSVNGERIVDLTHPYFVALRQLVAGQGHSKPENLHLAHGNVDGKMSLGVTPVIKVYGGGEPPIIKVALQRRKQEQIGLGEGAKWAMSTGGFVLAGKHESAEEAILRNSKTKGGVGINKNLIPLVYLITKEPFGVTNEGIANADGTVSKGNIYGTVGRAILNVDAEEEHLLVDYAAAKGEEIRFLTYAEFCEVIDEDNHTLDANEIGFIYALFNDELTAGPERHIRHPG